VIKARNHPKSLTTKQRRFVDNLIERFGDKSNYVKRGDLKKAAHDILGTITAPAWITRNMTVRIKGDRGRYDLHVLTQLPVTDDVIQEQEEESPKTQAAAKKAPAKKTTPKKPAKKKKAPPAPTTHQDEEFVGEEQEPNESEGDDFKEEGDEGE
jgi:hypothetical protein